MISGIRNTTTATSAAPSSRASSIPCIWPVTPTPSTAPPAVTAAAIAFSVAESPIALLVEEDVLSSPLASRRSRTADAIVPHSKRFDLNSFLTSRSAIVEHVSPPQVERDGPLQLQVSSLDYDAYVGVLGIGRVQRGVVQSNAQVGVVATDGSVRKGRILGPYRGRNRICS